MPGNSVIGALRVDLGLNSANFASGLKNASGALNKFGVQVTLGLETIARVVGQVVNAMPQAIKASIDHADALAKSAQKAGTTVEALSRLEYAAKLSDISLDGLTGGLQKLSKSMADVASGSGPVAAFKALGVEVKNADGTLRSNVAVLGDVADRFARMENGATKTAIAVQLFGKSGAELIPLLNEGADGLKRYADESDQLGITISTRTAKASEAFNDTLTRIQAIMAGVVNKITEAALPALQSLADKLASPEFAAAAQQLAVWVVQAMSAIVDSITLAIEKLSQFGNDIKKWASIASMLGRGDFGGIVNYDRMAELSAAVEKGRANNAAWKSFGGGGPAEITVRGGNKTPLSPVFTDKGAAAASLKAVNDQLKAMNADLASQKEAWEELQQPIKDTISAVGDSLSGAMSGLISDLIKGKDAVGSLMNAFGQLGDRLIQMAMDAAIQGFLGSLVSGLFGGGGGLGVGKGLTGAATYGFTGKGFFGVPSFDGGGFTGYGAGPGLDGKGGFMAMLHPNETVLDHSAGQGTGGFSMSIGTIVGSREDAAANARAMRMEALNVYREMQKNPYRRPA